MMEAARKAEIKRLEVEVATIHLPAGRALRVEVERLGDGTVDSLRLLEGWTGPWRPETGRGLHLPGTALPELLEALQRLAGGAPAV